MTTATYQKEMSDSDLARFWSKVQKSDGCWLWTAAKDKKGYGIFQLQGKAHKAHRIAYEITYNKPLGNLLGCHTCDNPSCVRPDHIVPGTSDYNAKDRNAKGRTRAPYNHHRGGYKLPSGCNAGERNPRAKMTWGKVRELRSRYASGKVLLQTLAQEYGIAFGTADKIVRHETWKEASQ